MDFRFFFEQANVKEQSPLFEGGKTETKFYFLEKMQPAKAAFPYWRDGCTTSFKTSLVRSVVTRTK